MRPRFAPLAALAALAFALHLHTAAPAAQEPPPRAGLVTLYQHDPFGAAFSFSQGDYGGLLRDGQLRLDGSQLVYGGFEQGHLTVGFSADEPANLVDLGEVAIPPVLLTQEATGRFPVNLFATLRIDGRRLVYQPANGSVVRLGSGNEVFGVPQRVMQHALPVPGHCYVARFQTNGRGRRDLFVKFVVVEHRPNESVTLRWESLSEF